MEAYEESGTLVVCPEGAVDAACAAQVEAEIRGHIALHPGLRLCVDAERITYISSSGLRVLLKLRRESGHPLTVRNVSPELYEIFEITGFSTLLDVRRRLREVSVDGCEIIGHGASGVVYRLDSDTVVKVYREAKDILPTIEAERSKAREAFLRGVPTAIPFDIVRVGERYGSVFEMLDAHTCNDFAVREPERLPELIGMLVRFLRQLHGLTADPGQFPDARERFAGYLPGLRGILTDAAAERLRELIMAVPERLDVLHGDMQLKNVLITGDTLMLIDMDSICVGDPVFEFAGLYTAYVAFNEDDPDNTERFFGISRETTRRIYAELVAGYLGVPVGTVPEETEKKISAVGLLRFLHVLTPKGMEGLSDLKRLMVRRAAERLEALAFEVKDLALWTRAEGSR